MTQAIMITIKSKWCRLMESGDKTIEVRKNKALANAIKKIIAKYGKCLIVVCESGTPRLYVQGRNVKSFIDFCTITEIYTKQGNNYILVARTQNGKEWEVL